MPRAKASLLVILTTVCTVAVLFLLPYTPAQVVRTARTERGSLLCTTVLSGVVSYARQEPCANAQAGRVEQVYAQTGQRVKRGDLLFKMDTSAQEVALASVQQARYAQKQALQGRGDAAAALTLDRTLAWQEREAELKAAVEAGQIRAGMDGIVEGVYASEGAYVGAGTVLGALRDEQRCVVAASRMRDEAVPGTAAALEGYGAAVLDRVCQPTEDGMQRLIFLPLSQDQLSQSHTGDRVTVEWLRETRENGVLVPLSAMAADGRIWYVEDGRARSAYPGAFQCGGEMIALDEEWEGRTVILLPDDRRLSEGCAVREAMTR